MISCNIILGIFFFTMWMFCSYVIHILAHIPHPNNFLFYIHMKHHSRNYFEISNKDRNFNFINLLLFFGSWQESLDVLITLLLPIVIIILISVNYGLFLLTIFYIYEAFLSEGVLDHNPNISGRITKYLACGQYHLTHHKKSLKNFSFYITLWDKFFMTEYNPAICEYNHDICILNRG